jgi:hypothetical protein
MKHKKHGRTRSQLEEAVVERIRKNGTHEAHPEGDWDEDEVTDVIDIALTHYESITNTCSRELESRTRALKEKSEALVDDVKQLRDSFGELAEEKA